MPALAITAVNPATDTITAPAHGLNTGDGFVAILAKSGTVPGGLSLTATYYAIRTDANNVKLATSSANAIAGTAIDITSAGTGPLLLLQGIPYRRPRNAVAGVSQIYSADDNNSWDALAAMHALLTGQAQSIWTQLVTRNRFYPALGTATGWTFTNGGSAIIPAWVNAAAGVLTHSLDDVPQGSKLAQLKFALSSVSASPGGALVVTITAGNTKGSTTSVVATYTVANGSFPTVPTDQVLNLLAASPGLTVTVAASGGTYTRSAGSFITDGFFVGQVVQWSGFSNAGNNAQKTITALTATVMTVATAGLVNESGGAGAESVTGVSPVVDDNTVLIATFNSAVGSGANVNVGALRTTSASQ